MPAPDHGFIEITLPQLAVANGLPSFAWVELVLPLPESIFSYLVTDHDIDIDLPSLMVTLSSSAGATGQIAIVLGWPQLSNPWTMDLRGGGHLAIILPTPNVTIDSLTSTLLRIALILPKPVWASGTSQDILGWIDIELPTPTGVVHLLSENRGHVVIALPLLTVRGRGNSGSTSHLDIDLPFIFFDSTLLSEGLIDLAITLPCLITTATGDVEAATLTYRTIVMNTMNFGVTEYGALTLKGMTDVFGKTIAINANELVSFGNTLDDTEHIDATLQTGTLDFSNKIFTKPRDIWITLRSGKAIKLTIKDNEVPDDESVYYSEPFVDHLHKTRVKIGRGFYSEFFDMTLQNVDGELVDIKDIHVFSETVPGRKR